MTITPDRLEEIARSVEAGTMSLSDLQSAGLFTEYGGSDLLTNTDAALALVRKTMSIAIGLYPSEGYLTKIFNKNGVQAAILDENSGFFKGESQYSARAIIAALIRAGEGQRKGKQNV